MCEGLSAGQCYVGELRIVSEQPFKFGDDVVRLRQQSLVVELVRVEAEEALLGALDRQKERCGVQPLAALLAGRGEPASMDALAVVGHDDSLTGESGERLVARLARLLGERQSERCRLAFEVVLDVAV